MEFLDYANAFPMLSRQGIAEHKEGDLLRLVAEDDEGVTRRVVIGQATDSERSDDSIAVVEAPREELGEIAERIVHRLHIAETALIPASRWQDVLDVAAFDLASDEAWLEVDAEAAMHQTRRDPLILFPNERHMVKTIVSAIMTHGDSPKHEVLFAALEGVFVVHVRVDGSLSVLCANAVMADAVLASLA